jgi:arylsulfatase A-like enzyme
MSLRPFAHVGQSRDARSLSRLGVLAIVALSFLGAAQPPGSGPRAQSTGSGRSNLLIIIADDHGGGTLGIEGDPRRATPNLDALAREGVLFERAYCNSPLCTPSRQSLITGKLPHSIGVTQLATRLPDSVLTLGQWLRGFDYDTPAIGKMHFNGPGSHGFTVRIDTSEWQRNLQAHPPHGGDHRRPWRPFNDPARVWLNADVRSAGLPAESMQSAYFVDQAIAFLKGKHERPFAMIVSFHDPHSPFCFPRGWEGRFPRSQFSIPQVSDQDRREQPAVFASLSPDDVGGIQAAYFTSLAFVDSQVGRLIGSLGDTGLANETLVIYVGDNGYMLGQHGRFEKHCLYEPAVRIPLIVRWPGQIGGSRRVFDLVEMIDILPTVLNLLRLPLPPGLQGIDHEPLLRSRSAGNARSVIFSEYLENEEAMVRSARYKLIVGTGRRLRQDGYQTLQPLPLAGPYQRLYDLDDDPNETKNLSGDPGLLSIEENLLNRMFERLVTTRPGQGAFPPGLSRLETIHWCLVPRDRTVISDQKHDAIKNAP